MRSAERDVLLFILAVAAGAADGWSYFGLGHAFVANMTGNTVLLGIAVFQKNGNLLHPLISLGCYAAGAAMASFFARNVRPGIVWAKAVSWTLLLESLLLGGAEVGWATIRRHTVPAPNAGSPHILYLLLAGVALAIGLQSGAMLQLKVPGVVTTYITGTWTNLMSGVVRFATQKRGEAPPRKLEFEERLLMQGGILGVYFCSAVLTGWLFRHRPVWVGALPAVSVLSVALYSMFALHRAANRSQSTESVR